MLIANVTEMLDTRDGHKGLHSALLRDWAEAATMIGRLHSAAAAVKLGYAIEPDGGKTGRSRSWRIVGIPQDVMDVFSKRADQIQDYYIDQRGLSGCGARTIAARRTRALKRGTGVDELTPRWHSELEELGWTVDDLIAALDEARAAVPMSKPSLTVGQLDDLAAEVLSPEGPLLQRSKVFTRSRLIAEVAPLLYGHDPAELDRLEVLPLCRWCVGRPKSRLATHRELLPVGPQEAGCSGRSACRARIASVTPHLLPLDVSVCPKIRGGGMTRRRPHVTAA